MNPRYHKRPLNLGSLLLGLLALIQIANANDELPLVPKGFAVDVIAKEPVVSNPCVMAFDRLGRICIAQGPQWRGPTPETPGDRVDILLDKNGDGQADAVKTFAEGFNSIQGIAWHGNDLWVANAPDLTVVRDSDGDDQADVYVRVYTGLGNLEHSLHGLNFGPDGKLYMSKGNSKGYNRLDQLAPLAFRKLWGLPSPKNAPDYTPLEFHNKESYRRKYHTPQDDWGQQGGILKCDPYQNGKLFARNLEIVAQGFRNPWDISFDDGFNWLGTDNDQTQGDKIFAPFQGSHFGWGHPWSYHWTGIDHLPTVPASASLFEGSGTGVIYYHAEQFPEEYRNLFFVNDWMRREVYAFKPRWDGAMLKCEGQFPPAFARAKGGRSLPASEGQVFDPTDIEVGPDGALYILSWGQGYGGTLKNGKQVDAGRVYRIRYANNPLTKWEKNHRSQSIEQWTLNQLFNDLGANIPAWRVVAQNELLRRGQAAEKFLLQKLTQTKLDKATTTWAMWTLGRMIDSQPVESWLSRLVEDNSAGLNIRIQAIRILALRAKLSPNKNKLPDSVGQALSDPAPRIRHAAVMALAETKQSQWLEKLLELAASEKDRIVYYSTWNAIKNISPTTKRKSLLIDSRSGVRLALLLGLFFDNQISAKEALPFRKDPAPEVAALTNDWLVKTGKAAPLVQFDPPPGEYNNAVNVSPKTSVAGSFLTYTLDGSRPTFTSPRVRGPIRIESSTQLRIAINQGGSGNSQLAAAKYEIRKVTPFRHRAFVSQVRTPSGRQHVLDWTGLQQGKRHYTDRSYYITDVPAELAGLPFIQMANGDDRSTGSSWLSMESSEDCDVIVAVDARNPEPLEWMKIGQPEGFEEMDIKLATTDPVFRLYRKSFPAGKIVLGGNTNHPQTDSGRGNYLVIFDRKILKDEVVEAKLESVLKLMETADPERGRELFLHPKGAGCFKCHRMEGIGGVLAPDLSDIGSRTKSAQVLIESILEPSKVITEGFAQQKVLTYDGQLFAGAVIEETGQAIKLVTQQAEIKTIQKSDIEKRAGSKLSPMPSGFGKMMTAQQVADTVAWLMTQKTTGDRNGFSFRDRNDKTEIFYKKQRVATYLKRHPKLTRHALVNVTTPSGIQVTRNFPARKPEDIDPGYKAENGIIHPLMHPGIWIGFGDVNGEDYWRLQSKVVFDRFVVPPQGTKDSGQFKVRNKLMSRDGQRVICTEQIQYTFTKHDVGMILKVEAEYVSHERDFYFGDQEESGLAIRVASPLRVQGGNGTILNSRGEKNGAGVWGKTAEWFDYAGTVKGRHVGILVMPSPKNSRKSWLHARDYGVVVTNPFPKQPKERREPYVKTWVKKGEPFKLSYALLIHESAATDSLDKERLAKELQQQFDH